MLRHFLSIPGTRKLWTSYPFGSVATRVRFGIWSRPHYAFGTWTSAQLARALGLKKMSVIEFGVAGGNGLVALEEIAAAVSADVGIDISVHGFDSGEGLPAPVDYRDLPYVWGHGFYKMDVEKLKARLKGARLWMGDVSETVPRFLREAADAPVGFISFDLDFYSSTKNAFTLFNAPPETRLPRTFCYFDDVIYPEAALHNPYIGELCAIREFNEEHEKKKICPYPHLTWQRDHAAAWNEQIYVMHDFEHPLYTRNITPQGQAHRELPLRRSRGAAAGR